MIWLLRLLGYRDREYHRHDFCVRIETVVREIVSINHMREGISIELRGMRIGRKWEGIEVHIPEQVDPTRVSQIARDLESAFRAMRYGYVIARLTATDIVPETERAAAMAELHEMGYEIEVSNDRKQIRQKRISGTPRQDIKNLRKQAPHMMSLLQAGHGTRQRLEILAKSNEF